MRRDERILNEALAGLSDEQRLYAWMDAMRRVGGMGFASADDQLRGEVFDIEQSTPEEHREWFGRRRDRVLAANAVMKWLLSGQWCHAEAALSRIATLLSLMVIVKAKDTREVLLEALSAANEDNAEGAAPEESDELGDEEVVRELAAFCGAMFAYDDSPLSHFWAEVLKTSPIHGAPPRAVDLRGLVQLEGEPIQRVLTSYARQLAYDIQVPAAYVEKLQTKHPLKHLSVAECMLPPVDAQLERNSAVLRILRQSRLVPRISKVEITDDEIERFTNMLHEPRKYVIPSSVINSFEEWLYPEKERRSEVTVWHVWDDYINMFRRGGMWGRSYDDDER